MKKIYLDYAATTPIDPEVFKAMRPYFGEKFGNAGSVHSFGQEAIAAVDLTRGTIAKALGAHFREIVFTGSATEANNLAIRGVITVTKPLFTIGEKPKIITTSIEHESVLETCRDLEREGIEVVYIPIDKNGLINLTKLERALDERTVLVSVIYAQNEVGTIQPIAEIGKLIEEARGKRQDTRNKRQGEGAEAATMEPNAAVRSSLFKFPLFHTDAVQAFQYLNCDVQELGVDLITISAHKIYGPKGIGALYARQIQNSKFKIQNFGSYSVAPIITGGGQEFGLRSGTENVPSIVGFGRAVELAQKLRAKEAARVFKLRNYLSREFKKVFPKSQLNGADFGTSARPRRLPNNINIFIPDFEAQFLLTKLDLAGIAASAGSACSARSLTASHVLKNIGYNENRALRSVRFSLGRFTKEADIKEALKRIKSWK